MTTPTLRLVNWNVEWATLRSRRGKILRQTIEALAPDILCITEGYTNFPPDSGHLITSQADYGYPLKAGRRKVLLWSKRPWRRATVAEEAKMPSGRYVEGVTETPLGDVRVVGVCIPWRHAHVSTGRRNRAVWEDHLRYLAGLKARIPQFADLPLILTGDFNQRIPPAWIPERVSQELLALIEANSLTVVTSGLLPGANHPTVDHIVLSSDLSAARVWALPATTPDGRHLSDHEGVAADISTNFFRRGT